MATSQYRELFILVEPPRQRGTTRDGENALV
jgi:hypothetical protein